MIMERNFQPVIIFSFSKKECEAYALQMSKLDFNSGKMILWRYMYGGLWGGGVGGDSGSYVGLQIEMYGFKLWSDT